MPSKQRQVFMTASDEEMFCAEVRSRRPFLRVLDGNVWEGRQPVYHSSLMECESRLVYLWDPSICAVLPTRVDAHGRLEGPISGLVIQVARSRLAEGDVLLAGRVATGWWKDEDGMEAFVDDVWKALAIACAVKLFASESGQPAVMYKAGVEAAELAKSGKLVLKAAMGSGRLQPKS